MGRGGVVTVTVALSGLKCGTVAVAATSHLYDAGAGGPYRADHVDIGRGGGTVPLQGLAIGPGQGKAEGGGGGQEAQPGCQKGPY